MKKRILSLILCVCLFSACIPVASAYSNVSGWAQEAVDALGELGLLPDSLKNADMSAVITRAQMCQMAVLVFNHFMGTPDVGPDSTDHFTDTSDPAINYAFEQGIVGGVGDNKFAPNEPLIRQDFFKIVYNLMGAAYWDKSTVTLSPLDSFKDAANVSGYAVEPTQVMISIGVVLGDNNKIEPKKNTTAQEAIVMFFRAYRYLGDWFNTQIRLQNLAYLESAGYHGISNWAINELRQMNDMRLIPDRLSGCDVSAAITRAQMCAVALHAYNRITGETYTAKGGGYFTDTNDPDVNAAKELQIVGGDGDGKFRPNDTLTREEFFKIMANFITILGYSGKDAQSVNLTDYQDGDRLSRWAVDSAKIVIYIGAVRGDGQKLNPASATSIEEALAIFLRCYKYADAWGLHASTGNSELIDNLLSFARSFEGYPYVYGGNGPNSFDCSGFVLYVYRHFGYSFSRGAQEQYLDGQNILYNALKPGDLVFFCNGSTELDSTNSSYRNINHVGLYLGDGYFIHAANSTRGVVIDNITSGYYRNHFWGACRIIQE